MDHRRKIAARTAGSPAVSSLPEICTEASVLVRLDGTIGAWGADARRMWGRSPEQVVGLPFSSLFTAECRDAVDELARAAQSQPHHLLATGVDSDGTHFDAEVTSTRTLGVRDGGIGVVEVVRDVTEPRAVAASLLACSGGADGGSVLAALGEVLRSWVPCAELTLGAIGEDQPRRLYRDG